MSNIAKSLQVETITQEVKTNASTSVPVQLKSSFTPVRSCTVIGNKAMQTVNVGTVYLGWSSVDGQQPIAVASGEQKLLQSDNGEAFDLAAIYLDVATANDGIILIYS